MNLLLLEMCITAFIIIHFLLEFQIGVAFSNYFSLCDFGSNCLLMFGRLDFNHPPKHNCTSDAFFTNGMFQ